MMKKIFVCVIVGFFVLSSGMFSVVSQQIKTKRDSYNSYMSTLEDAQWTVMVYLDADNNLEYNGLEDFNEMAAIGSTSAVNIVVQFDRIDGYDYNYGDWTSTKRYLVTKYMQPTSLNAIMDIGEADMSHPQTLIDFVSWSMDNYPATNYCLVLWDHGTGWKYAESNLRKGVCEDFTNDGQLTTEELRNAIKTVTNNGANKLEIIGFDACLMGMIEVAYELKDFGQYMVASEETEPVSGWNYKKSLEVLVNNPIITADQLGATFVNTYEGYEVTLATINLQDIHYIVDKINDFGEKVVGKEIYRPLVNYAYQNVESFQDYDFVDLYHLAQLIKGYTDDPYIATVADSLMTYIDEVVVYEKHDSYHTNVHGLSIYLPYYSIDYDYRDLRFAQDTYWDELIIWLHESPSSRAPTAPSIDGKNTATVNQAEEFIFRSTDPDGDDIYIFVDWGYNDETDLVGPKKTGEAQTGSHVWFYEGGFIIKAIAIDENGVISDWGYLTISVPKQKTKIHPGFQSLTNLFSIKIDKIFELFSRK